LLVPTCTAPSFSSLPLSAVSIGCTSELGSIAQPAVSGPSGVPLSITYVDSPSTIDPCSTSPVVITRTWTVSYSRFQAECSGGSNSAQTTQTITFNRAAPTITVPAPSTVACNAIPAPDVSVATATDSCGGSTAVVSHVSDVDAPPAAGTQTACNKKILRTYKATNCAGKETTAVQEINVHSSNFYFF